MTAARESLRKRIAALIDRLSDGSRDEPARDALLCQALGWQARAVDGYRRLLAARGVDPERTAADPGRAPDRFAALPTDVFRYARVASHPEQENVRVFRTSGTTVGKRGEHHLSDLSLYDRAARAAAAYALFPDIEAMPLLILAPPAAEAPDSSLCYMLSRFVQWFGSAESLHLWRDGRPDIGALRRALDRVSRSSLPVALLGTSLALAHAEQELGSSRWSLGHGSRIMLTGGFKGREQEVDASELSRALQARYGVADSRIIQEYGMTELCSQMYETSLRDAGSDGPPGPRRMWTPGWVRFSVVDPETLEPLPGEAEGLLRIDDLANLDSVCAVQTSDMAQRVGDGFRLLGRAPGAPARGCSIAVEEAMGGRPFAGKR
jgi:hypothetical protein